MTTICASTNKHCFFVSVPFYVFSHKCTHTTINASQSENGLHKSLFIKTIPEPKSPSINAFYYRCTFYFPSNRNPHYFQKHNRNSEKQHPSMNKYLLFLSTLTSNIPSFHFSHLFLQILPTIHLPNDHSNSAPSHHAILISFPTNTSFAFMRNAVINMVKPTALVLVLTGMQLVRLHNQTVDRGRTSDQLRLLHPRKLLKAFVLPITPSLRSLTQLSVYPKYFRAR